MPSSKDNVAQIMDLLLIKSVLAQLDIQLVLS
jgi:hypothetical protein